MRVITLGLMLLALTGCQKEAEQSQAAGSNFKVDKLFTVDGCTVYRFMDAHTVYFTNCSGSASYTYHQSNGKTSVQHDMTVSGGRP